MCCVLRARYLFSILMAMGDNRALPAEREHGVIKKNGERGSLATVQPVKCFSTGVTGVSVCFASCCMQRWALRGKVSGNPFGLNIYSMSCFGFFQLQCSHLTVALLHAIVILWGSLWLLLLYNGRKAYLCPWSENQC